MKLGSIAGNPFKTRPRPIDQPRVRNRGWFNERTTPPDDARRRLFFSFGMESARGYLKLAIASPSVS